MSLKTWAAAAVAAVWAAFAPGADAKTFTIRPGPDAQNRLQAALIEAEPGDTVRLGRGRFELTAGLSLDVDEVTIRGDGPARSVLSFRGQTRGAEGLLVTSDRVILRDFAIEDAKGDAIKANGCADISFVNLRIDWTGGPKTENGAYGLYPVQCTNVLVEGNVVRGASDAGIYVGQSRNIIVRRNTVEDNVAGIEIENSFNADVFDNIARRNTGGILVFDLPGLPQQGGRDVRLFRNVVEANNTPNFAPAGNIVASLPTGTGIMVMANQNVHVFNNTIGEHGSVNIMIVAYPNRIEDAAYNPLPRDVVVRGNAFGRSGFNPAMQFAQLAQAGVPLPDVVWDGATQYVAGGQPRSAPVRLVVDANTRTDGQPPRFLSLGVPIAGGDLTEAAPSPAPPPLIAIDMPAEVVLPRHQARLMRR